MFGGVNGFKVVNISMAEREGSRSEPEEEGAEEG
jgi:hypothetical protein